MVVDLGYSSSELHLAWRPLTPERSLSNSLPCWSMWISHRRVQAIGCTPSRKRSCVLLADAGIVVCSVQVGMTGCARCPSTRTMLLATVPSLLVVLSLAAY